MRACPDGVSGRDKAQGLVIDLQTARDEGQTENVTVERDRLLDVGTRDPQVVESQ